MLCFTLLTIRNYWARAHVGLTRDGTERRHSSEGLNDGATWLVLPLSNHESLIHNRDTDSLASCLARVVI